MKQQHPGMEPLINGKQAAAALRLPYYWFADNRLRTKYRIPHYRLVSLVRYRLSELSAWATHSTAVQGRAAKRPFGQSISGDPDYAKLVADRLEGVKR